MRRYISTQHRFFDYLVTFLGSICCLGVGLAVQRLGQFDKFRNKEKYINIQGISHVSNLEFHFHPYDLLELLARDSWPSVIDLDEFSLSGETTDMLAPVRLTGQLKLHAHLIESAFIQYFESVCSIVENKYSKGRQSWPEVWKFGRVVRNAFAHRGEIYITNPRASAVTWKTLTYSPANNGLQIVFRDLAPVEIILLMEDMDSAV